MSAGRSQVRRVTGSIFGALLAVGTASGAVVGLSSGVASARPAVTATPTVTLHAITSPVAFGSEEQTFTGTVTAPSGDGYPVTGKVTVTATGTPLCTDPSVSGGAGSSASFTCSLPTEFHLLAGPYTVKARYAGGTTSTAVTLSAKTSATQSLRVTSPKATSTTLNTFTTPVAHGFESQTFTGTVTGVTGDGYPTSGAVTVVATTSTTVCTGSLTGGSGFTATYSCYQSSASLLGNGTYSLHARYAGGTSSAVAYSYTPSTSTPAKTLSVVTATPLAATVTLNPVTTPVVKGAEGQTFSGTVSGPSSSDGYPKTGAVIVSTTTHIVLCTGSLETGSGDSSPFTCVDSGASDLTPGTYHLVAHYTGGVSSNVNFSYDPSTSTVTRKLTVTNGTTTTTVLSLNHTSRAAGAETSETFSVTVTGKSGDGYPKGIVTIQATTGKVPCITHTLVESTVDSSTGSCTLGRSTLPAGTYTLTATYTPTTTHSSSTTTVHYAGSSSTSKTFKVTTGLTTSSSLSLNATSRRIGEETGEVFTVTVTGQSGDGYPLGTVKVKTSSGTALCTRTTVTTHTTDSSTFTCSPKASVLTAGTYTVVATYTPATPSSSTHSETYAPSTASSKTFIVTSNKTATRIYGSTPDATAAQELETVFPGNRDSCPGTAGDRPVVLATDAHYPDALAASYLAKWLGTGMLLTPTSSMTDATLTALREEGITHVYVVGGPLAVSTAVVDEVEGQSVYDCGGGTRTGSTITVTRIYGQTQYTTAEDIAETPGSGFVGSVDLAGAYGLYNDTNGRSSSAPGAGTLRTAILASGAEFQDAEASATLAYADDLPLLLTTPTSLSSQALSAISSLGITQVILMGGPLAVTNGVVTQLVAHGVSVLRVAGNDYTDTAVQLADMELGTATGHEGLAWTPTGGVTVSQGSFYTDGLAGAVVAANGGAAGGGPEPMLLTESPTSVGTYLTSFLEGAGSKGIDSDGVPVGALTILGGPLAVSTSVVSDMEADL
jgi:putative cell wall-binding protein